MNLFKLIEKAINEHGSSAILKERLELIKDYLSKAEDEKADLQERVTVLENENRELRERLETKASKEELGDPVRQWGCYKFEGKNGLFCPVCFEKEGVLMPASRLPRGRYSCPSCKAQLS